MKKKALVFGLVGVVAVGAAAFVFASAGTPEKDHKSEDLKKLRGTEAYYADQKTEVANDIGGELVANLAGGSFVKLKLDVEYRPGMEWEKTLHDLAAAGKGDPKAGPAGAYFAEKNSKVRSALILTLGRKSVEQLQGANLLLFKEELVRMINDLLFPDKVARVEDVYFKDWVIQK